MTAEQFMHPEATSVRIGSCPFCPAVRVCLLDATGSVFASAVIPVETVDTFCQQARDAADGNLPCAEAPRVAQ